MWARKLANDGFAILPETLTKAEILQLRNELSASELRRTRAGIRHALSCPAVSALAQDYRLLRFAKEALGGTAVPFRATFFDKSPQSNWLVAWHQDTALPLRKRRETTGWGPWSVKDSVIYAHAPAAALEGVLALRIHLDESNALNGPLRALPGTHRLGVLNDETVLTLVAERNAIDCLVPRGGVFAMRPLVIHASSKSQTEMPRRVLHIEYAASSSLTTGLELASA